MIDISWPLTHGMTTEYRDRETFGIELMARFDTNSMEESQYCMGTHTGTHIDSPAHFIKGGKTIDQFPLSTFNGPCIVIDASDCTEVVTKEKLASYQLEPDLIVLLKTKNSQLPPDAPFYTEFVYLSVDGARYLADQGVKLVGIDYLSIERNQPNHPTHKALLSNDIPILEGLRLSQAQEGRCMLICLPLRFIATEAAPCRAALVY